MLAHLKIETKYVTLPTSTNSNRPKKQKDTKVGNRCMPKGKCVFLGFLSLQHCSITVITRLSGRPNIKFSLSRGPENPTNALNSVNFWPYTHLLAQNVTF